MPVCSWRMATSVIEHGGYGRWIGVVGRAGGNDRFGLNRV